MKNWKISKLQIRGFKAFSSIDFNLDACSLLTLEGPNGYGKTTVFDAIELLFTGRISRIADLCNTVMPGNKKLYKDNLYWNTKNGDEALKIKMELVSMAGDEHIAFARTATIVDLKVQANNRADKFDIFKLYSLADFASESLGELLPSDHLDIYFGENFCKNYSMLNYLQQGQSTFIFGNKITDRKDALENLLKTRNTKDQIDLCVKVEKRLAMLNSAAEKQKIAELLAKIELLTGIDSGGTQVSEFVKISTQEPTPGWDLAEPFAQLDEERYQNILKILALLTETFPFKDEIRLRRKNSEIERYITEKDDLISLAVSIGKHFKRYDALNAQHLRLSSLAKALSVLKKSPETITSADLATLRIAQVVIDNETEGYISNRDVLIGQLNGRSAQVLDLKRVRADLFIRHQEAFKENGSWCALCGIDWETVERLSAAIEETTKVYDAEIGVLSARLVDIQKLISQALDPLAFALAAENEVLERGFERLLHSELGKNRNNFDALARFNERLAAQNVEYSSLFTYDAAELDSRKTDLIARIRDLKQAEGDSPPLGWETAVNSTFAVIDDFYKADPEKYLEKRGYVTVKHRVQQNSALQDSKRDLAVRQSKLNASVAAKEKISRLKALLTKTERDYSAKLSPILSLLSTFTAAA